MKKLILASAILALMIIGCTAEQQTKIENTWSKGKEIGSKVLSEDTKKKLTPIVNGTEKAYIHIKDK